jgi:hypothetical protein
VNFAVSLQARAAALPPGEPGDAIRADVARLVAALGAAGYALPRSA